MGRTSWETNGTPGKTLAETRAGVTVCAQQRISKHAQPRVFVAVAEVSQIGRGVLRARGTQPISEPAALLRW